MNNPENRANARIAALAACVCASFSTSAMADSYAYIVDMNGDFGVVDVTSGSFTQCGSFGFAPAGLAVDKATGNLYTAAWHGTGFYQVNPSNGGLTLIGNASIDFRDLGSTTHSVYAMNISGVLYSVDVTTGATTEIGQSETLNGSTSLSAGAGKLYLESGEDLYSVSAKNAKAKLIGGTSNYFGGMATANKVLYGGDLSVPPNIYTINTSTGSATKIATVQDGSFDEVWGAAPTPKRATGSCPN